MDLIWTHHIFAVSVNKFLYRSKGEAKQVACCCKALTLLKPGAPTSCISMYMAETYRHIEDPQGQMLLVWDDSKPPRSGRCKDCMSSTMIWNGC